MYCHILRVRAIPTLESTDSMIEILSKDRKALPRYDYVLALANIEHVIT